MKVDLADEETQSQGVLSALLIILTMGLFFVAVLDCLWETRRLTSSRDNDGGHIFLRRRETKTRDREKEKEKEQLHDDRYKTGGALYAPKLLDVPINRVSLGVILLIFSSSLILFSLDTFPFLFLSILCWHQTLSGPYSQEK